MRNNQISFYITKEKEKMLFNYILSECNSEIFMLYRYGEKETFENGDEIKETTYFVKPVLLKHKVTYEMVEGIMTLNPFDTEVNFSPFVLYERSLSEESSNSIPYRIYRPKNIKNENKALLKSLYKQISDWIKKNSCKYETIDSIKIYYVE